MKTYKAASGSRISDADAQAIGLVVDDLAAKRGGVVLAADVLAAARPTDSPIHKHFEWNDSAAAEKYRLDQARYLVRSVRVIVSSAGGDSEIRPFHVVTNNGERGYMPLDDIAEDVDLMTQVIAQAKRELEAWFHKHQMLRKYEAELGPIFRAIEDVVTSTANDKAAE